MYTPRFIVFEGLDGSGKSTQIQLVSQQMKSLRIPHIKTREPTSSALGNLARNAVHSALVHEAAQGTAPENEALALLFAADRYQHLKHDILPALEIGDSVLCDRYYFSNMVYQGENPQAVQSILDYTQEAIKIGKPDIVFFLDVEPEECLRRISTRRGQTGLYENITRLKNDRERFLNIFKLLDSNAIIIKCTNANEGQVFEMIWSHITA